MTSKLTQFLRNYIYDSYLSSTWLKLTIAFFIIHCYYLTNSPTWLKLTNISFFSYSPLQTRYTILWFVSTHLDSIRISEFFTATDSNLTQNNSHIIFYEFTIINSSKLDRKLLFYASINLDFNWHYHKISKSFTVNDSLTKNSNYMTPVWLIWLCQTFCYLLGLDQKEQSNLR